MEMSSCISKNPFGAQITHSIAKNIISRLKKVERRETDKTKESSV